MGKKPQLEFGYAVAKAVGTLAKLQGDPDISINSYGDRVKPIISDLEPYAEYQGALKFIGGLKRQLPSTPLEERLRGMLTKVVGSDNPRDQALMIALYETQSITDDLARERIEHSSPAEKTLLMAMKKYLFNY